MVSTGPVKQYRRITGYSRTDVDCIDFELSDESIVESFVDGKSLEGIYIKKFMINPAMTREDVGHRSTVIQEEKIELKK